MNPYINRPVTTGWITGVPETGRKGRNADPRVDSHKEGSFAGVLDREIQRQQEIRFSKHAQQRMAARDISLSGDELEKVNNAVRAAKQKGIRDSLIIMKDMAFIVNIPNNTVVTAVQGDEMKQNVYTNIDGAVII
ncbi:MAG: TIGR02530 family flagellar biosynthesis protein [Clostridia bacterium]